MPDTLCPFCGAASTRYCEIEDEDAGVECPWLEVLDDGPDPDILREDAEDRRRLAREYGEEV